MEDPAMELTQSQLQQIADYVKSQIPDWVYRAEPPNRELTERMLSIEEELKAQREIMVSRFEASDRRFESMDKRFEEIQRYMDKRFDSMDKRFEDMQRYMDKRFGTLHWTWSGGVILITLLMSLYQFLS